MTISVIIRTKGNSERAALLARAVDSVLTQRDVQPELIVVLNGDHYDEHVLARVRSDERIRSVVLDRPDLPKATEAGRACVTSAYFAFLDDDDELLPGALARRAAYLNDHPDVDCVVTNGEYVTGTHSRRVVEDVEECSSDLIASIVAGRNWLPSCAGTFRAKTVGAEYFERHPVHEWTLLAFRLASTMQVALVADVTYRIHATPGSESAGGEKYMRGAVEVMEEIAGRNRDPRYRRAIAKALAKAQHHLSSFYRINGKPREAWEYHWRSLRSEDWWKYLPYTAVLASGSRRKMAPLAALQSKRL